MSVPKYVTVKRGEVEYISGLDRCQYTIKELSRAALRDVGKFVCQNARKKIRRRSGKARRYLQAWVRKKECDLKIGYKPAGWYGGYLETGTDSISKIAPIYSTVAENIDEIRRIEGQYLSAIEDENKALGLINENEEVSDDE